MKAMVGYIIILFALCLLSVVDYQTSEARESDKGVYYAKASFGHSFTSSDKPLTKTEKKKAAENNNRLAAWPERVLRVKHRNFLLAEAFAIRADQFQESMGKIISKHEGYIVFIPAERTSFDGFVLGEMRLPVVINEITGDLGVVTGNVEVKLKSAEVAGLVSSFVKSEILSVNDTEKTATLKLPPEQDLTIVIHTIRNYAGVESADFQILPTNR